MVIHYTTIVESRFDAPFIGTLISGVQCSSPCRGCHNQHLRSMPISTIDSDDLLSMIESNPFSQGIILGGLEWLDGQYDEALHLIRESLSRGLEVILYTRRYLEDIEDNYPELLSCSGLYIKVGPYIESLKVHDYSMYGVPLATSNQKIYKIDNNY